MTGGGGTAVPAPGNANDDGGATDQPQGTPTPQTASSNNTTTPTALNPGVATRKRTHDEANTSSTTNGPTVPSKPKPWKPELIREAYDKASLRVALKNATPKPINVTVELGNAWDWEILEPGAEHSFPTYKPTPFVAATWIGDSEYAYCEAAATVNARLRYELAATPDRDAKALNLEIVQGAAVAPTRTDAEAHRRQTSTSVPAEERREAAPLSSSSSAERPMDIAEPPKAAPAGDGDAARKASRPERRSKDVCTNQL